MEQSALSSRWHLSVDDDDTARRINASREQPPSSNPRIYDGLAGENPGSSQPANVSGQDEGSENHNPPLQYHHQRSLSPSKGTANLQHSTVRDISKGKSWLKQESPSFLSTSQSRPGSAHSTAIDVTHQGRKLSPQWPSNPHSRNSSSQGGSSPDSRNYRHSVLDLQRLPYAQQSAPTIGLNQHYLQASVGNGAALLSREKTLEMYRGNVKKTLDPEVQYAFATFLVETAQLKFKELDAALVDGNGDMDSASNGLYAEARQILQHLADRSYPFAQYYLADGLANGVLNNGKEDDNKALPLFVAASKRGHAESAYRAALCYEFGWGSNKSPLKAAEYFRQAASKNHPGAMIRLSKACLTGDLGMDVRYREGIKWLKRAADPADEQYNAAPYELGVFHESGYGDDIFRDETYAAQLFTRSAELGHTEANFRLGCAYEHGELSCPGDPGLSVHFYTSAASHGHAGAMLALCAWYMVGAPPVLEKDENEAYEWARCAGAAGHPKAQYTVGYFTEMGIGCQRDPLEANVWYVRAADQNDPRAKSRLAMIQAVYSGKPRRVAQQSSKALEAHAILQPTPDSSHYTLESQTKKRWKVF